MYAESKSLPKDFLKPTLAKESGLIEFFEGILRRGVRQKVIQFDGPFFMANVIVYLLSLVPLRGWNLKQYSPGQITQYTLTIATPAYVLECMGYDLLKKWLPKESSISDTSESS
jgi:hypothetical protein